MGRAAPILRAALAAALALSLAACLDVEGATDSAAAAMRHAAFYGSDVIVQAPPGYCVDPKSVQRRVASGFALLAGCAHLSSTAIGMVPPAVITVSVLPRDTRAEMPTAAQVAEPWKNVGVSQQIDGDGIAVIQVERGGDRLLPAGDPRHWRAAMLINGHLVGLAVYGEPGSGVAGEEGKALLFATANSMLKATPVQAKDPES